MWCVPAAVQSLGERPGADGLDVEDLSQVVLVQELLELEDYGIEAFDVPRKDPHAGRGSLFQDRSALLW
jgi:hypothetical protein